jgi:hypothetical protein
MTARQIRRAAERKARKEARKQENATGFVPQSGVTTSTRAETNRANAQYSTGPKTFEGKANSSRNSFKHGLYSKQLVTGSEEAADLDALKADLRAQHQPANDTEEILVNEMAEQFWRIRRARRLEASLFDDGNVNLTHLAAVQRMMTSAERGFHKALSALRQVQKDRGFVPQFQQNHQQNPDCEGAALEADSYSLTANAGFVPQFQQDHEQNRDCEGAELKADGCSLKANPDCPTDIDPLDWSRFWDSVNFIRSPQPKRPESDPLATRKAACDSISL